MSRGRRSPVASALALGCVLVSLASARALTAQAAPFASLTPTGMQWELRLEGIAARTSALQGALAANAPAGRYVRLGALAAAGGAWRDGAQRASARVEGIARFLLDPFRESRLGLYGLGGVSLMYDGFEHSRPNVVVGVGVESTPRHGRLIAAELALGGGVRVALVVRRARRSGR